MTDDKNSELQKAMTRASRYCAEQDRSAFDVRRKLRDWEVPETLHSEVIDTLKKENFIDEWRFARTFVRSKFRNNQWGRIKIAYALAKKNVANEIIGESLKEINGNDYINTLKALADKKMKSVKADTDYEKKQKTAQSMASKGYETELIYKVVFDEDIE